MKKIKKVPENKMWYRDERRTYVGLTPEQHETLRKEAEEILCNIKKDILNKKLATDFGFEYLYICTSSAGYVGDYTIFLAIPEKFIQNSKKFRIFLEETELKFKNTKWRFIHGYSPEEGSEHDDAEDEFYFYIETPMPCVVTWEPYCAKKKEDKNE